MVRISLFLVIFFLPMSVVWSVEWNLVFEDHFEREEVGDDYTTEREAKLSIVDGQLLIVGGGATAMIDRPFAMDVRLEFDSTAWPEMPPCDLSVRMSTVYLLGFGARSNSANHLLGPNIGQVDLDPPFIIEEGKKYHMVAQREGNRIWYEVNGTRILDATSDNLLGGPSFNRVGFITWAGMLVDNVKVYERSEPHPDTPVYITSLPGLPLERDGAKVVAVEEISLPAKKALDALNAKDFEKAKRLFEQVEDVTVRLAGLANLYGDPDYIERPAYGKVGDYRDYGELGAFAELWAKEAAAHPENGTLEAYLPAVKNFGGLIMSRRGHNDATILIGLGEEHNPFYHKAKLFKARYTYWDGMEGASAALRMQAHEMMRELSEIWPDNRIIREYSGPPVPWGGELNADAENHPAWAAYLREAYAREIAVLERFCDLRQAPNGQFGGGLGDDVEMMRKWVPIAAISSCSTKVLEGIERLTEGVWQECPRGYSEGIGDVEHSAEPTADTLPTMLLLRYGDPRYYEFNLTSCRTLRDVMMGIDAKGYPRFKSTLIGARGANTQLIGGGDTGYHARAMKHFLWLSWYGNHEAEDWYVRWVDGWRNTAMIDEPNKPAGVVPGTIWYPSGSYYPPNGEVWYSPKARNYYGTFGLGGMIHQSFLNAYWLTGDREFLHPVQRMMDWSTYGPYEQGEFEPGSVKWFRAHLAHGSSKEITSLYRFLTGERVYDEYTKRFGTATQQYQIDQDLDRYLARFERAAKSLRNNLWYFTTEVMSTDRLHLPAVDDVWGAYTGAILTTVDAEMPTMAVTYETPDPNFAALVTENTDTRVRVWLYSFWEEPTGISLKFWRLRPGEYILNQGEIQPGEREFQHRYRWGDPEPVRILHKADAASIALPPQVVWVVDIRLHEAIDVPEEVPDLAIHPRDVRIEDGKLVATVHNIGTAPGERIRVCLDALEGKTWVLLASEDVRRLSQPVGFVPFTAEVSFEVAAKQLQKDLRVAIDPYDEIYEICETNNVALVRTD